MYYMEERKERARNSFRNHEATIVLQNDDFFVVDWKNRNGSGEYAVRYLLDIKKGNFVVSGDLGDSVASWYNKVIPEKLKSFVNDISYYIGKFQCTSDNYTYEMRDIRNDLEEIKQEAMEDEIAEVEQINEDFSEMENILSDMSDDETYSDELIRLFEKYFNPWYESGFRDLGKRISQRVVLWAVGFQMACQQLGI